MAGADQAAAKIQDGVEIDGAERRYPFHQAHLVENDGDNDGDKELKPFHPEMDDPEPPGVDNR